MRATWQTPHFPPVLPWPPAAPRCIWAQRSSRVSRQPQTSPSPPCISERNLTKDKDDRECRLLWIHDSRHRVDRVLGFFCSRPNWDSPTPSPPGECAPPFGPGGGRRGRHTRFRERGLGESQFRRGNNIHCDTLFSIYKCTLWFTSNIELRLGLFCYISIQNFRSLFHW